MTRALVFVAAISLFAQSPEQHDLTKAEQEIARIRELVNAGAAAPSRLRDAESMLEDAKDSVLLARLLYGKMGIEELREQDTVDMLAAARRRLDRQTERVARMQKLVDAGVASRNEVEPAASELEGRKLVVDLANSRARLFQELLAMAHAEKGTENLMPGAIGPDMEYFPGRGKLTDTDMKVIVSAYEKEFGHPMPVSAMGETAAHRAMGYDHRGRIDVGLNPDGKEGLWLRKYLTGNSLPYVAFRRKIDGSATGPHIHIGMPSPRLTISAGN